MQNQSVLPIIYEQVEYIQNNSPTYIDTGIVAQPDLTIEAKAQLVQDGTTSQTVWGGRVDGNNGVQFSLVKSTGTYQFMYGGNNSGGKWDYDVHTFKVEKNRCFVDGVQILYKAGAPSLPNYNIYLFATNTAGVAGFSGGSLKMFYCKIWHNDELICDFIPCYHKTDGTYGMYDLVRKTFFPMVNF